MHLMKRNNLAMSRRVNFVSALIGCAVALLPLALFANPAAADPPPNDDCADRSPVFDGPTVFSTVDATTDGPALACGFGPAFRDIWFNYQPAASGHLTISLCGSDFDTVLAVYADCVTCPPLPLSELHCSDDACGVQSELAFDVVAGMCYKIRVGGFDDNDFGNGIMLITFLPITVPPNDDCEDRLTINDGELTPWTLVGATLDGPSTTCNPFVVSERDVWFNYTATCGGLAQITFDNNGFNSAGYQVYNTDDCALGTLLLCEFNDGNRTVDVSPGQSLKIRLFGFFNLSSSGTLEINCIDHPVNDDCEDRVEVADGVPAEYDLQGATLDGPPTSCVIFPPQGDVWFNYTAPCTGAARLTAAETGLAHQFAIYEKLPQPEPCMCPVAQSEEIACIIVGFDGGSGVFPTEAGHCYKIRVLAPAPLAGSMTIECVSPPANDDCSAATPISNGVTSYDATGSSLDPDDPPSNCTFPGFGGGDVWFIYQATCSGAITVDIAAGEPSKTTVPISIYSGNTCPPLQSNEIGCANGLGPVVATPVFDYLIRVGRAPIHTPSTITIACMAPVSDLCADRTEVLDGMTAYSTLGAATDGPTTSICGDIVGDIWFNYTATCDGALRVSANNSNFNAAIAVYDGCDDVCGSLVELGCAGPFQTLTIPDVAPGDCYKIRVGASTSFGAPTGEGILNVLCAGAPPNDLCDNRIDVDVGFTPFDAGSASPDTPAPSCGPFAQDIWFNYTHPTDSDPGTIQVFAFDSNTSQFYGVVLYDGCSCPIDPLDELVCDLSGFGGLQVPVSPGQCIKIRVGNVAPGLIGPGGLTVNFTPAPPPLTNDDCIDREVISDGDVPYNLANATTDGPPPVCFTKFGYPNLENDVWFNYTAPIDGYLRITSLTFNTAGVVVYGGCGCGTELGAELGCGFSTGMPLVPVVQNQCYKIRVGVPTFFTPGQGVLHIETVTVPANDSCENRLPILLGATQFNNAAATTEVNAFVTCGGFGMFIFNDIWYNYTPPCNGTLTLSVCGTGFDPMVAVYKGCNAAACPPTAAPDGCGFFPCPTGSEVVVPVLASQCYKIRVGSNFGGGPGTITLAFDAPDGDGDGTPDCLDGCPLDPDKIAPGICGCGVPDIDTDGDLTADCLDGCPLDPLKTAPGLCGCGVPEGTCDDDEDGVVKTATAMAAATRATTVLMIPTPVRKTPTATAWAMPATTVPTIPTPARRTSTMTASAMCATSRSSSSSSTSKA
jgi:hypothetical protein